MKDLTDKVAFVTGGASGIGLGIVKALLKAGCRVAIGDIRQDHLDNARDELFQMGFGNVVMTQILDVTDRTSLEAAADAAEAHFGKIHILVSNAGVGLEGPLDKASEADWEFGLSVNLMGPINGFHVFWPRIAAHGEGGHIVNTSSMAGLAGVPSMMAIYGVAKAGIVAFSESIRDAVQPQGIGVSVLCPGPIKSNIHQAAMNRHERFRDGSGFSESEATLGQRKVSPLWMDADKVGEMVREAIETEQFYIITHGEWREMIQARHDQIIAAMPTELNPELIASLAKPREERWS